jgi:tetratricopeptide (TPR) repeat protein
MFEDPRGILLTTTSAEASAAFEHALIAFLGQRPEVAGHLQQALAADAGLVPAHALGGFLMMLGARRPLMAEAARSLAHARASLGQRGGTRREIALVSALGAWVETGNMWRAAELLERALTEEPHDLLLMRIAHAIRFMLGDSVGMRVALGTVLPAWNRDMPGHAYLLGCYAFALVETGDAGAAEHVGRGAVTMEPRDLWGAHAVAHALGAQGRDREGLAWLSWLDPYMSGAGAFARHIHWHRALSLLDLGEVEAALDLYDRRVRDDASTEVRDVMNAASLLWRIEAAGLDAGAWRWDELADIAERRIGDHAWAFVDIHYVLCLAAAGRRDEVEAMLASIAGRVVRETDSQARVHAEVGFACARAVAEALGGKPEEAESLLSAARLRFPRLGGSRIQRDLLDRIHARATLDAQRRADMRR